jgi:hypothetical protein
MPYNCATREVPISSDFVSCERRKGKYLPSKQGVAAAHHAGGNGRLLFGGERIPELAVGMDQGVDRA